MGFPLARVLQIGSIGAVLIPGVGPVVSAGMLTAAKQMDDNDPDSPSEEKRKEWEKQDKRWIELAKKLEHDHKLSGPEKGVMLRARIRADLRASEGKAPSDADVNIYAEAVVASARVK